MLLTPLAFLVFLSLHTVCIALHRLFRGSIHWLQLALFVLMSVGLVLLLHAPRSEIVLVGLGVATGVAALFVTPMAASSWLARRWSRRAPNRLVIAANAASSAVSLTRSSPLASTL